MAMESPLPVRNGVNATRLRLPRTGSWATVADYLLERFGHVDPEGILRRFDEQQIVGLGGTRLTRQTPLGEHEFIWYYRSLPEETPIPFETRILHQDEHLLVVDKPHFLPTTPGGRFIQESALVRLRNQTGIDDLVPMHRLDRATAGVILFAVNPQTRGAYQMLFERREIAKRYKAVVAWKPDGCCNPTAGIRRSKPKQNCAICCSACRLSSKTGCPRSRASCVQLWKKASRTRRP